MGYEQQPAAQFVQEGVVPVNVNGVPGVMPVGMAPPAGAQMVMTGITRVYVGNLSWETEWQDLKDHMRQAGEVRLATVVCTRSVLCFKIARVPYF